MRYVERHGLLGLLLLFLLALFAPSLAWAGPTAPRTHGASTSSSRVQDLKQQGDAAMEQGRSADALALYDEAYRIEPSPALLYNRGRARNAVGDFPGALSDLEEFERTAPAALRARAPGLSAFLEEVRGRVASVTVRCSVRGAEVLFDGRPIGTIPLEGPLTVAAGTHELEIRAQDHQPYQRRLELAGRATAEIDARLVPLPKTGTVSVRTSPAGAGLRIGERSLGVTPAEIVLPPGSHTLTLVLDGHEPAHRSVVVEPGRREDLTLTLEPRKKSILTRWWFWSIVGAVAVGGAVTAIALTTERDPDEGTLPPGRVVTNLVTF